MLHPGLAPGPIGYRVPLPFVGMATPAVVGSSAVDPDPTGQQVYMYKGCYCFYDDAKQRWAFYDGTWWQWW